MNLLPNMKNRTNTSNYKKNGIEYEINWKIIMRYRYRVVEEIKTMPYTITDGNEYKHTETIEKAAIIVSEWYDYILDGPLDSPKLRRAIKSFHCYDHTLDGLNEAISEIEEEIAKACGYEVFVGHGNYTVSPSSAMGLNLVVKEE